MKLILSTDAETVMPKKGKRLTAQQAADLVRAERHRIEGFGFKAGIYTNEGGMAGMGVGLGAGVGFGQVMGQAMASAMQPAGQDPEARVWCPETVTLPLCSRPNASPFWII